MRAASRRGRGFALMLAVFLIVTLAAIGVSVLAISQGQVHGATQDEQGVKAYQAARSGLDWGAYRLLIDNSCAPSTTLTYSPPTPAPNGLSGFFAEVACEEVGQPGGETEGSVTVRVYRLTATGCNANPCTPATSTTPANAGYVERQLQLTLTR